MVKLRKTGIRPNMIKIIDLEVTHQNNQLVDDVVDIEYACILMYNLVWLECIDALGDKNSTRPLVLTSEF